MRGTICCPTAQRSENVANSGGEFNKLFPQWSNDPFFSKNKIAKMMYDALCGKKRYSICWNTMKQSGKKLCLSLSSQVSGNDSGTFAITVCPFQITYCLWIKWAMSWIACLPIPPGLHFHFCVPFTLTNQFPCDKASKCLASGYGLMCKGNTINTLL